MSVPYTSTQCIHPVVMTTHNCGATVERSPSKNPPFLGTWHDRNNTNTQPHHDGADVTECSIPYVKGKLTRCMCPAPPSMSVGALAPCIVLKSIVRRCDAGPAQPTSCCVNDSAPTKRSFGVLVTGTELFAMKSPNHQHTTSTPQT